jgi:hypothetical protein
MFSASMAGRLFFIMLCDLEALKRNRDRHISDSLLLVGLVGELAEKGKAIS